MGHTKYENPTVAIMGVLAACGCIGMDIKDGEPRYNVPEACAKLRALAGIMETAFEKETGRPISPKKGDGHTPGPWTARGGRDPNTPSFYNENFAIIGPIEDGAEWVAIPAICDNEDNARLVAAAPDLLAACKAFVAFQIRNNQNLKTKNHQLAVAAIARAEGTK